MNISTFSSGLISKKCGPEGIPLKKSFYILLSHLFYLEDYLIYFIDYVQLSTIKGSGSKNLVLSRSEEQFLLYTNNGNLRHISWLFLSISSGISSS